MIIDHRSIKFDLLSCLVDNQVRDWDWASPYDDISNATLDIGKEVK